VGSPTLSKLTASYGMVSLADEAALTLHLGGTDESVPFQNR